MLDFSTNTFDNYLHLNNKVEQAMYITDVPIEIDPSSEEFQLIVELSTLVHDAVQTGWNDELTNEFEKRQRQLGAMGFKVTYVALGQNGHTPTLNASTNKTGPHLCGLFLYYHFHTIVLKW